KIDELPLREIVGLPGERRRERRLRDAARAVAARAALRERLAGCHVGGARVRGPYEQTEQAENEQPDGRRYHVESRPRMVCDVGSSANRRVQRPHAFFDGTRSIVIGAKDDRKWKAGPGRGYPAWTSRGSNDDRSS